MAPTFRFAAVVLLSCCSAVAVAQNGPAPIQPGAPGQPSKAASVTTASAAPKPPSAADIAFMQDMIMHHGQAVEMTELAKTRASDPEVREMAKKIDLSQTTEIQYMRQWLTDCGIAPESPMPTMAPMPMDHSSMSGMDHGSMAGMDHSGMAGMDQGSGKIGPAKSAAGDGKDPMDVAMMPGMLTPRQMQTLQAVTGAQFDVLFLTGMMQHHSGALLMVKSLMDTPGSAQDPYLFDFAQDVDNGQLAEINIMQNILRKVKP